MTPRKLYALIRVHKEMEAVKWGTSKSNSGHNPKADFIDNIPGW